jgi:hypothetical protein
MDELSDYEGYWKETVHLIKDKQKTNRSAKKYIEADAAFDVDGNRCIYTRRLNDSIWVRLNEFCANGLHSQRSFFSHKVTIDGLK